MSQPTAPARRMGVADAVFVGLGAMLGTGVFTAFAPAAAAAGGWLLLALALAAVVAACNAFSSADLAATYPESGGTYVYATAVLGRWPGRLAGVAFLAGKTASAAAAAGALGVYLAPGLARPAAVAAVVVATAVNAAGLRWTVTTTRVLVTAILVTLAVVVAVGLIAPGDRPPGPEQVGAEQFGAEQFGAEQVGAGQPDAGPLGVLTAAALLFFAFAGYARIATLGEEVRDPQRTLRLAIPIALAITLAVYLLTAVAALYALGVSGLAASPAPLADVVARSGAGWLTPAVRAGAAVAMASVLLTVLVGVSRTTLAMARRGDLPAVLATIGRRETPWRADMAAGAVAAIIAVLAGPVAAIALSACCVLLYYAVTNASALRLPADSRRWPMWTAWLGLASCLVLAASLPWQRVLTTAVVVAAGTALSGWYGSRGRQRYGPIS